VQDIGFTPPQSIGDKKALGAKPLRKSQRNLFPAK